MAFKSNSSARWDSQINKLKEVKEKRSQGIDVSVSDALFPDSDRRAKAESNAQNAKAFVDTPFVRKINLNELIDISRAAKGEKPLAPEKKTPFIQRDKEIKTPSLDNSRSR